MAAEAEIDSGRVAFALAQTTLSMLVASGVLDDEVVHAAADNIENNGNLGMSKHEVTALVDVMRASTPQ